ncbi:MAG: hypothetical protein IRZ11_07805, partial [Clostridia bacterium]|nr:hypothetical protein [Clostridia bacterium]
ADEIRSRGLSGWDALVLPGGGSRGMAGQIEPLGEEGARRVRAFVEAGGLYLGSCAGAFLGACVSRAFVEAFPYQRWLRLAPVRLWNDRDAWLGLESPGVGRVRVEVAPAARGHPVVAGLPDAFELTHYNGPMFLPSREAVEGARESVGLLRFVARTARFTPSEAFFGPSDAAGSLFDGGVAAGAWAAWAGRLGAGRVVLCGSHPEFGADPSLAAWDDGARLVANALLWQASRPDRPDGGAPPKRGRAHYGRPIDPEGVAEALRQARDEMLPVEGLVAGLAGVAAGRPAWLARDRAPSIFGEAPEVVWAKALSAIAADAREAVLGLGRLAEAVAASDWDLGDEADRRLLERIAFAASHRSRPEDGQDMGFEGIAELARLACRKLRAAAAGASFAPGPPGPFPYEGMDVNPYHLVASSYLGAVGIVAGARLLVQASAAWLDDHLAVREMRRAARR